MHPMLLVFLGGGAGSLCRYLVALGALRLAARPAPAGARSVPWEALSGTLAVNLIGCLLIGLAWGRFGPVMREELRLALVVGFLGGFTTFSALGWETLTLTERGHPALAVAYAAASLLLGWTLAWIGHRIGGTMGP